MKKKAIKPEITAPDPAGTPSAKQVRELFEKSGYIEITNDLIAKTRQEGSGSVKLKIDENATLLTLINLFLIGEPVSQEMAQNALQPVKLNNWQKAGFIKIKDEQVTARVQFYPYQDLLLMTDFKWDGEDVTVRQPVMGITRSTETLANLTIRKPSRLTLDLGTGSGVQAMLAARHSEKVIAVDICPRALAFARFNAQLNGIKNIEFIEGDLFQAVEGQTFDLIVSNPPFLISPENQSLYRDNPLDGDEFVRNIVQEMPRFLNQDGYGQVLCNWIQPGTEDWLNRLQEWYKESDCDVWVMRKSETDTATYAQRWLKDFKTKDKEQRQKAWLDYYQQNDVAAIGSGLITLRRNSKTSHWSRIEKTLPGISKNSGEYIDRIFQSMDFLKQTQEDQALLKQRLRVSPYLRIDKQMVPEAEGTWTTKSARLMLTQGIHHQITIDPAIMEIVMYCKPSKTLGDLLKMIAIRQTKSPDEFISTYLPVCRRLISLGFLWPEQKQAKDPIEATPSEESKQTEVTN